MDSLDKIFNTDRICLYKNIFQKQINQFSPFVSPTCLISWNKSTRFIQTGYIHSKGVKGAAHAFTPFVENVGVDHCRTDVLMPQQFLDGSNIVAVFQQVGGK
jgi:hypothetical protein